MCNTFFLYVSVLYTHKHTQKCVMHRRGDGNGGGGGGDNGSHLIKGPRAALIGSAPVERPRDQIRRYEGPLG